MMQSAVVTDVRQVAYRALLTYATRRGFNEHALASMLASYLCGESDMPVRLGLDDVNFAQMLSFHFPGYAWPDVGGPGEWDASGMPEKGELESLLLDYAAPHVKLQPWWIGIVIAGCAGRDHMWRDMGLFERRDLSLLLQENFPQLAAKNDRDMKWKKFIYKQLCEREGIIACPAPTCDQCASFKECFSPED